nr:MAG TPA: hypothetical protein [Caudoviricetes sp.]
MFCSQFCDGHFWLSHLASPFYMILNHFRDL